MYYNQWLELLIPEWHSVTVKWEEVPPPPPNDGIYLSMLDGPHSSRMAGEGSSTLIPN